VLLRNPIVQVLSLEIGEFSGKEPAIAFSISAMTPHFGRMEIDHPHHLLEMVVLRGVGEFAAAGDRPAWALAERQ
jgi:hypothetical protein